MTPPRISFTLNGRPVQVAADADKPLLWVLRDDLQATGTKYGCGMAQCGACTVHVDGQARRSCVTPLAAVAGQAVTTVEGVAATPAGRAVQAAWQQHQVAQCGYCQSGQVMGATALLLRQRQPADADIDAALSPHLCRCGTYARIRAAVHTAARALNQPG